MHDVRDIPDAVLHATLASGQQVASVIGLTLPRVSEMTQEEVTSFRQIWQTRRDIDIPIWLKLGRNNTITSQAWTQRISDLISFIDQNCSRRFIVYSFSGNAFVLFVPETASAFSVDLPDRLA